MARTNATNFTGGLQFPYATAAADLFKKEDVQVLAQAVDQHDHTAGKGLTLPAGAIPNGFITSAMIADGTITSTDIADSTIATQDLAAHAITQSAVYSSTPSFGSSTTGTWLVSPVFVTLVTTGGQVVAWVSTTLTHTGGQGSYMYAGIQRDGVGILGASALQVGQVAFAGHIVPIAFVFSDTPAAASHTYNLVMYNASAGTASINAGMTTTMVVTELKR